MTRAVTQRRPRTTTRVAVVGIDGAGRTTICRLLQDGAFIKQDRTVVHTLRPDETPGAPFRHLSRKLHSLAAAAELIGQPELKAAALYLQLSAYAPVASRGDWRHEIDPEVLSLYALPLEHLLERFRRRFRVNLPDVVVLLDVSPAEAVRRLGGEGEADGVELAQRLGGRDVSEARLAILCEQYLRTADWLETTGVAVHRIDVTGRSAPRVANLVRGKLPRSWAVPISPPLQEAPHLQWAGDLVAGGVA